MLRDHSFIQSDFPVLPADSALQKSDFNQLHNFTQFAVLDYDKDHIKDIFDLLDSSSFLADRKTLKNHRVTSNYVVINFKSRKA